MFVLRSVLWCLYWGLYCDVCIEVCTVMFVLQCLLWCLYWGLYCDVCIEVCTVMFVLRSVLVMFVWGLYGGVCIEVCTVVFVLRSVLWCLYWSLYCYGSIEVCTVVFVLRSVLWCLYWGLYCGVCIEVYTVMVVVLRSLLWCLYWGLYCGVCIDILQCYLYFRMITDGVPQNLPGGVEKFGVKRTKDAFKMVRLTIELQTAVAPYMLHCLKIKCVIKTSEEYFTRNSGEKMTENVAILKTYPKMYWLGDILYLAMSAKNKLSAHACKMYLCVIVREYHLHVKSDWIKIKSGHKSGCL